MDEMTLVYLMIALICIVFDFKLIAILFIGFIVYDIINMFVRCASHE